MDCTRQEQIASLNQLWGGGGWIPPFLHRKTQEPVTIGTLFRWDPIRLLSISKRAANQGIALPSLYQPGGLLYRHMVEVSGVVMWTEKTAFRALRKAIKLKWELPNYASATDQRIPENEATIEQSMETPSREMVDLVNKGEEIYLPRTAKNDNMRIPSVKRKPLSAPDEKLNYILDEDDDHNPPSRFHREQLRMSHQAKQRCASYVLLDIPAARAQLKNAEGLSDAEIGALSRYLRRLSV